MTVEYSYDNDDNNGISNILNYSVALKITCFIKNGESHFYYTQGKYSIK